VVRMRSSRLSVDSPSSRKPCFPVVRANFSTAGWLLVAAAGQDASARFITTLTDCTECQPLKALSGLLPACQHALVFNIRQ
jgi:hypothetical protein